ncbi:MAG: type II toxin-antitoxin system prevent-host-death family antitoxin [Balneolales bacterium]
METTYSEARANFAAIWDKVIEDREQVVIKRRGKEDIVMIARSELDEVMETAHLLRSPRNAERLLSAIKDSDRGRGIEVSLEELKQSILADEE